MLLLLASPCGNTSTTLASSHQNVKLLMEPSSFKASVIWTKLVWQPQRLCAEQAHKFIQPPACGFKRILSYGVLGNPDSFLED